ncbi:MAG: hypothetical protein JW955_24315 [Sedimentisphaerales bacterium]|nr:hypothetical protein [Sedimentisphaerales bacterium]
MNGKENLAGWGAFAAGAILLFLGLPAQAKYAGGSGTAEDPYLIGTAEQMNAIGLSPEDWAKCFRLVADIDMNDLEGAAVHLIGRFQGVFDGDGHTIANLTYAITDVNSPPEIDFVAYFGLFCMVCGPNAVIEDLGLVKPDLRPVSTCSTRVETVGALIGTLYSGSVRNCFVEGGQVLGDKTIGGLVGESSGTVSECWSTAEVSGQSGIGGLVGKCRGQAEVLRSHAASWVADTTNIGGLVGTCGKDCKIDGCFTAGTVSGGRRTGGLVGYLEGSVSRSYSTAFVAGGVELGGLVGFNGGLIDTSWAGGYVTGGRVVGGLVGFSFAEDFVLHYEPLVANSYAAGRVHGESIVGGLIGQNQGGVVYRCYSTGRVAGATGTGGLIGANDFVPIADSFWDVEASGLNISDGGVGKTTAEMQDVSTYVDAGWDFEGETLNGTDDLWEMPGDQPTYPELAWESALP